MSKHKYPRDWARVRLEEVSTIQTGIAKGKSNIKNPVTVPYLRVANVQDGYLDLSEVKSIEVGASEVERYTLKLHDILLTEGGDYDKLGRGHVWQNEIEGCVHQNHIFAVRVIPDKLDPFFLSHYISSFYGKSYFRSCSKQTTNLATINSTQLRAMPLPLPALAEQKKITEILGCFCSAVNLVSRLITAKSQLRKGLMQQLLSGKRTLADFEKEHWQEHRLGELFTERAERGRDDLPLLAITGENGVVPRGALERRDTSSEDKSKYLRICPGDIGYNTMRMWQGVSALSQYEGIVSPAYTIVMPAQDIDAEFFSYLFKFPPIVNRFWRYSQGLVDDTLNLKFANFARIKVTVPRLAQQRSIALVLKTVDTELRLLRQLLSSFQKQKRGLMQQLLSGKIRVKV